MDSQQQLIVMMPDPSQNIPETDEKSRSRLYSSKEQDHFIIREDIPHYGPQVNQQLIAAVLKNCKQRKIEPAIYEGEHVQCFLEAEMMCGENNKKICIDMLSLLKYYIKLHPALKKSLKNKSYSVTSWRMCIDRIDMVRIDYILSYLYEYHYPETMLLVFPDEQPYAAGNDKYSYPSVKFQCTGDVKSGDGQFERQYEQLYGLLLEKKQQLSRPSNDNVSIFEDKQEQMWCRSVFQQVSSLDFRDVPKYMQQGGLQFKIRQKSIIKVKCPWLRHKEFLHNPCLPQLQHYCNKTNNYWCYTWNPNIANYLPTGVYIIGLPIEYLLQLSALKSHLYLLEKQVEEMNQQIQEINQMWALMKLTKKQPSPASASDNLLEGCDGLAAVDSDHFTDIIQRKYAQRNEAIDKLDQIKQLSEMTQSQFRESKAIVYNYQSLLQKRRNQPSSNLDTRMQQIFYDHLCKTKPENEFNAALFTKILLGGLEDRFMQGVVVEYLLWELHPVGNLDANCNSNNTSKGCNKMKLRIMKQSYVKTLPLAQQTDIYIREMHRSAFISQVMESTLIRYLSKWPLKDVLHKQIHNESAQETCQIDELTTAETVKKTKIVPKSNLTRVSTSLFGKGQSKDSDSDIDTD